MKDGLFPSLPGHQLLRGAQAPRLRVSVSPRGRGAADPSEQRHQRRTGVDRKKPAAGGCTVAPGKKLYTNHSKQRRECSPAPPVPGNKNMEESQAHTPVRISVRSQEHTKYAMTGSHASTEENSPFTRLTLSPGVWAPPKTVYYHLRPAVSPS